MRQHRPQFQAQITHHRAVFREDGDRLFIAGFDPVGACRGWYYATESALPEGISLASFEVHEDPREVLVTFKLGSDTPAARARIVRWASSVGHERPWFHDDFVDLRAEPQPIASIGRCDSCETTFREDSAEFHEQVRESGHYPGTCPVCGSPLATWTGEYLDVEDRSS